MIIALDGHGGDHAPKEIVKGALEAANKDTKVLLVGIPDILRKELDKYPTNPYIEIIEASQVIEMDEEPAKAVRRKRDSSLVVAAKLVGEEKADALVSAGSTGAQLAASIFYIGRIKGIKRPAIGLFYPTNQGMKILVDAGANPMADAQQLEQFAVMGSIYAQTTFNIENPKVGLINNGTEGNKGTEVVKDAFIRLKNNSAINFSGNIEGKDIPGGKADVMVCDGFTGNVILKLSEGLSSMLFSLIKQSMMSKWYRKIGALLLSGAFQELKASLDSTEYGGAPLLGVKGVSIICHGSSNSKAIASAIKAARNEVQADYVNQIEQIFQKPGGQHEHER